MKVIFLDIDGVLNGNLYIPKENTTGVLIDLTRLELVKQIVDATGAEIVLSSSWKEHWEKDKDKCDEVGRKMNEIFADKGLYIFDKTPKYHNDRKKEIVDWLNKHPDVSHFAVIDDGFFEEDILKNHFVLTSKLRFGIDEEDARKAISILTQKEICD